MFFGEHKHTLDSKGRVFLPAKMREELGEKIWVCKGLGKNLQVYPDAAWSSFCAEIDKLPATEARYAKLYIYAGTSEAALDSQGRLALTPSHRTFAELDKNVYIIGNRDHIEIWSETAWEAEQAELDSEKVFATLKKMGF